MMHTAKLFSFPSGRVSPEAIIEMARDWNLKDVIIIGWDNSDTFAFGASSDNKPDLIYLLEYAKKTTMEM